MKNEAFYNIENISEKEANAYVDSQISYYSRFRDIDYSRFSKNEYNLNYVKSISSLEFDIFLSNRFKDKIVVSKLYYFLEKILGYHVYVDWIVDSNLNRKIVTKKSVGTLKVRLTNSKSFMLAKTKSFRSSRWIMWEVGYYDSCHKRNMAQIDLGESDISKLEFLQYCNKALIAGNKLIVEISKGSTILWDDWVK